MAIIFAANYCIILRFCFPKSSRNETNRNRIVSKTVSCRGGVHRPPSSDDISITCLEYGVWMGDWASGTGTWRFLRSQVNPFSGWFTGGQRWRRLLCSPVCCVCFLSPAFSSKIVHLNMQNSRAPRSHFVLFFSFVCFGLFYLFLLFCLFCVTCAKQKKSQSHCSAA